MLITLMSPVANWVNGPGRKRADRLWGSGAPVNGSSLRGCVGATIPVGRASAQLTTGPTLDRELRSVFVGQYAKDNAAAAAALDFVHDETSEVEVRHGITGEMVSPESDTQRLDRPHEHAAGCVR